jgi:hypothetical protein
MKQEKSVRLTLDKASESPVRPSENRLEFTGSACAQVRSGLLRTTSHSVDSPHATASEPISARK